MRVLVGVVFGILLVRLALSPRVREDARRRLTTAPESLRHAATSAKAALRRPDRAGGTSRRCRSPLSDT